MKLSFAQQIYMPTKPERIPPVHEFFVSPHITVESSYHEYAIVHETGSRFREQIHVLLDEYFAPVERYELGEETLAYLKVSPPPKPSVEKIIKFAKMPRPQKPIEMQKDVALTLDLRKMQREIFYKVDYLGRELIVRVTNKGNLEVHELVKVE